MKRTVSNLITYTLFSFLILSIIGIGENVAHDIYKTFGFHTDIEEQHILDYRRTL